MNQNIRLVFNKKALYGSSIIPTLDEIMDVRMFNFRMDADTPELREAVQKTIEKLKQEFPSYTFTAEFGKGGT